MQRSDVLRILRSTPQRLMTVARGVSANGLRQRPGATEWSMAEILNHLLLGERDLILPRLKRMLREDAPVFPSSTAVRVGFAAEPAAGDFEHDLAAFVRVRADTLAFLAGLTESDWQRLGTTPTRGTLTIEAYARYLARHDLEHLRQLEATRVAINA